MLHTYIVNAFNGFGILQLGEKASNSKLFSHRMKLDQLKCFG